MPGPPENRQPATGNRQPAIVTCLLVLLVTAVAAPARAGSVDDLATEIARRGGDGRRTAVTVRGPTPPLERLGATLAGLVVARLEGAGRVEGDAAAARRAGYERVVDVELAVDGAELVAVGRVLVVGRDLWRDAALGPSAPPIASTFVARAALDAELRAHLGAAAPAPATQPAAPQPRRWSFRALPGTLDLAAPLLAVAAADLDGDARAELAALTTDELVALRVTPDGATVVARARLDGFPPVPRARWPFGTLLVDPTTHALRAHSSERAGSYSFAGGVITRSDAATYPTCVGEAEAVPGVAQLAGSAPLPERWLAAACGAGLAGVVDASGTLRLFRDKTPGPTIPGVGTAFLLDDLDGDGTVELVASAYRAPGTGDQLTVYRLGDAAPQKLRKPTGLAAGVVGLAAGDFDGDGKLDVVAAARVPGSTQIELWVLE